MKQTRTHPVHIDEINHKKVLMCFCVLSVWCAIFGASKGITFEEFVGYPFTANNGYQLFPRGDDLAQGVNIPFPFPYFNDSFTFADVSNPYSVTLEHTNKSQLETSWLFVKANWHLCILARVMSIGPCPLSLLPHFQSHP